jgi:putative hemolysin
MGGFVITYLGRIPTSGDQIELKELTLEVVDMDGHRVDKLLVTLLPPTQSPDQPESGSY